MNGFLNILKPPGMSSAAVVGTLRRLTGEKRVGHAGTLDPEAAGVLPVMIGSAARLFDYLADKEKTYVAECAFGCETDTQDAQGTVTRRGDDYPSLARVREAAERLTGDILQRPSAYSAIKRNGRALYELARLGAAPEIEPRPVHIGRITVHGETPRHGVLMTVDCGRGTYIRALCEDLGRLAGCPAHMRFLLRTRTGAFTLDTAMTLEEAAACDLRARLLRPDWPLEHILRCDCDPALAVKAVNGAALPAGGLASDRLPAEGEPVRMYLENRFLGLAERRGGQYRWRMLLPPGGMEDKA